MSELLKIEYVDINTIHPYEGNAKIHTEAQVKQIEKSIMQFGMNDPIAVWNGEIIEGHGRFAACKELGIKIVPVIRLDNLTDEQRRAYTLVHNKLTMNTGFDLDVLSSELDAISEIEMADFGFIDNADSTKMNDLSGSGEIDLDGFGKDKYNCKCPRCGMLFSVEGKGNYTGE